MTYYNERTRPRDPYDRTWCSGCSGLGTIGRPFGGTYVVDRCPDCGGSGKRTHQEDRAAARERRAP